MKAPWCTATWATASSHNSAQDVWIYVQGGAAAGHDQKALNAGYNLVCWPAPVSISFTNPTSPSNFPWQNGDVLYRWNTAIQDWAEYHYGANGFSPKPPDLAIGEAFVAQLTSARTWDIHVLAPNHFRVDVTGVSGMPP